MRDGGLAVDQHHFDAGLRGDQGDAGAHHARAQHAHFGEAGFGNASRAARALFGGELGEEGGADDVARHGVGEQRGEIFALHAERLVYRQLDALEHRREDRGGGGEIIARAVGHLGGGDHEAGRDFGDQHHALLGRGIALHIPRGDGAGIGGEPRLGHGDDFACGGDGVHQPGLQRRLWPERLAREEQIERGFGADQAGQALGAARAGQQADVDFGQANHGLRIIGQHAIVAGQRQLETTAQREAIQGAGHRLAQRFDGAIAGGDALAQRIGLCLAQRAIGGDHCFQIGAGHESLLARGDDDAGDRRILAQLRESGVHFG